MSGFKRSQPGLRFSGEKITPDESDEYVIYSVTNPGTANATWWGTAAVAGTSATGTFVITNRNPDYPRNALFSLAGSANGLGGSTVITGFDQFGSVQTETIGFAGTNSGGTKAGTAIWGRVDSATMNYGSAVGNGTPKLGFVNGTSGAGTCWFGLPVKIGGTADVRLMSISAGTGPVSVNGGSISSYVDTTRHAFYPGGYSQTGTETINVWVVSSYNPTDIPINIVSNLKTAA